MSVTLNDIEQRVLGVLMEKSLTQPDGYPLTLNAVLLGANQKQNRDPVRECSESEISSALRSLELKQMAAQAAPAVGARSVRFRHLVVERFHWDRREQAVMAELFLRGRQTPGELRTHASRMTPFADLEAVGATLDALRRHDPPWVEELPREPGRSANRFRHLLAATAPIPSGEAALEPSSLEDRVSRLETELEHLKSQVAQCVSRMSGIDAKTDSSL